MKKIMVLGALLLTASTAHSAGRASGRALVRSSNRHALSGVRSQSGRSLGAGSRFSFSSRGASSSRGAGFRGVSGRMVGDGGGADAAAPTYSMIGAQVRSPGMFTTQIPIIETRDFMSVEAGGIRHDEPAIGQIANYSRGVFTDSTMSGYGSSSGGYGTLFSNK